MHKILFLLLLPVFAVAQKSGDKKIIVTLNQGDVRESLKTALVNEDFIVKDDKKPDTITTYPREFKKIPGYAMIRAYVNNNTVTLTGVYGLVKINDWWYTRLPKQWKPIHYYKGSHGWKLMMQVVSRLNGEIKYE